MAPKNPTKRVKLAEITAFNAFVDRVGKQRGTAAKASLYHSHGKAHEWVYFASPEDAAKAGDLVQMLLDKTSALEAQSLLGFLADITNIEPDGSVPTPARNLYNTAEEMLEDYGFDPETIPWSEMPAPVQATFIGHDKMLEKTSLNMAETPVVKLFVFDNIRQLEDGYHILIYCMGDNGLLHFSLESSKISAEKAFEFCTKQFNADYWFARNFCEHRSTDTPAYPGVWSVERLDGQSQITKKSWAGHTFHFLDLENIETDNVCPPSAR